jgi:O-methyltransferase involved in polyketide biosynthesis
MLQSDDLTGVSETLLVPLHYRVEESKSDSSPFKDEVAERFHDSIDYDWSKFRGESMQRRVMPIRTAILDDQVKEFLAKAPDGLVVNLGAGLDTRFYRLDNGTVEWIELDLPIVIALRRKLQEPENARHRLVAASVLDEKWVATVKPVATKRILLVAEGLLPYFSEEEHRKIFGYLASNFPGQEMLFQTNAPSLIQGFVQHSDLSKMRSNVELRWGLEDSRQVSSLDPNIEFIREFPLIEGQLDVLPEEIRQKLTPAMAKNIAKMVHVRFLEGAAK